MADQDNTPDVDIAFSRMLAFDQDSVSPEFSARSRKNAAVILQSINNETAATLAERMGVHESTISRLKSGGGLATFCLMLACLELKPVPVDAIVYTQPDDYK